MLRQNPKNVNGLEEPLMIFKSVFALLSDW